jgi:hypothetical protein
MILRPCVVVLVRRDSGGGSAAAASATAGAQQRFVDIFAALFKAVRLPLLSVL